MRARRRTDTGVISVAPTLPLPDLPVAEALEELGLERIVYDGVTGLPLHPFERPERADERIDHLGVIYLQIGKFIGFEELFGWEHYDRVLSAAAEVLQDDVKSSRLAPYVHSIRFTGADGFFILYSLPPPVRGRVPVSLEARIVRKSAVWLSSVCRSRRTTPARRRDASSSSETGTRPRTGGGRL